MLSNFPFPSGPRGLPSARFADQRRHDPLAQVRLPSGDVARLATRHADVVALLSDPRFSSDPARDGAPRMQPGLNPTAGPGMLVLLDPPDHTRLRRLLAGSFTERRISTWQPRIRQRAVQLVDGCADTFDFVAEVAFAYPSLVLCDLLGIPPVDAEHIRALMGDMLSTSTDLAHQVAAFEGLLASLARLVADHSGAPGGGLLADLIRVRDGDDRLSTDELVGIMFTLITAGHESVGVVLSRSLLRLLDPREHYESLVARPEDIPAAVEELLRLENPQHHGALIRVATEDVRLPSGTIRRGEGVVAATTSANRDPEVFDDPDAMNLGRRAQHVTFAAGIHHCLGAGLARAELREMLGVLVERRPSLALAVPAGEVPWTDRTMFEQVTSLQVQS